MLLTNQSIINRTLGKQHSGVTNCESQFRPEVMFNRFFLEDNTHDEENKRDSFPTGTASPYSYLLGPKGALLSSTTTIEGTGSVTANLTQGKATSASLAGVAEVTAGLSLIVSMDAEIGGSGSISNAPMVGTVGMEASLDGEATVTADASVIAFMECDMQGTGVVTPALRGTLSMASTIYVNEGTASVQQMAEGVWGAVAEDNASPGTMGEKVSEKLLTTAEFVTLR